MELPLARRPRDFRPQIAESMAYSVFHWQPLVLGQTEMVRAKARDRVDAARALPGREALETLRADDLRYVLVHLGRLNIEQRKKWRSPTGMKLLGIYEQTLLFEVDGAGS